MSVGTELKTDTDRGISPTRSKLWTAIIVALVVVGVIMAIWPMFVSARVGLGWNGVQVLLVAVIVAAIRSRK